MSAPKKLVKHAQTVSTRSSNVGPRLLKKKMQISGENTPENPVVAANRRFFDSISSSVVGMSPTEVNQVLSLNIDAGKGKKNLEIAAKLKNDPLFRRFRKPQLYVLLLQSLAAENERKNVSLCLQLFAELLETSYSTKDMELASQHLCKCFENCTDFTQLFGLKAVFQYVLLHENSGTNTSIKYLTAHMHVLVNSGQFVSAMDHFRGCMAQIFKGPERENLLRELPMEKLVRAQLMAQDCDAVVEILHEVVSGACTDLLTLNLWTEILSMALWKNHYELVKIIYVNVIMDGLDPSALSEAMLEVIPPETNPFLRSLSQNTVSQILHTLATHGDVASCLSLVEWYFLHKSLQGERALTKDLCLQIITAYCHYHPKSGELATRRDTDTSVKTVLDALDMFVKRRNHKFNYHDIVDAFSHKLNTYHVFDAKVAYAVAKEHRGPWKPVSFFPGIEEVPEEPEVINKKSNTNVHESAQGSVLKNTAILSEFLAEHLHYISQKQHSTTTRQIFINCVLAHLATYQNTSGIIAALQSMKLVDVNFVDKWLDQESYDIIIKSFSESPAAMATGLAFYTHMKNKDMTISAQNIKHFVFSALRGDSYNQLLEYYVYEYLKSNPAIISSRIVSRIRAFKNLNEDAKTLLGILENYNSQDHSHLEEIWDTHQFSRSGPILPTPGDEYEVFFKIDQRDKNTLEQILS